MKSLILLMAMIISTSAFCEVASFKNTECFVYDLKKVEIVESRVVLTKERAVPLYYENTNELVYYTDLLFQKGEVEYKVFVQEGEDIMAPSFNIEIVNQNLVEQVASSYGPGRLDLIDFQRDLQITCEVK